MKMNLTKSNNKIILFLNKKFYDDKFINIAINDFSNVCIISKMNNKIVFESRKRNDNLEIIALEFANYVLSLMKSSHMS